MACRLRVLAVVLVVAGAGLAGCGLAAPDEPSLPPPAAPLQGGPPSAAALCGPRPSDAEQPPDAWVRFDHLTQQQIEVIDGRLKEVLCRQGLWRKGVGFGVNIDEEGTGYFVMIHPGRSGLSARQILDRFLGRGP
jgi:hypothetical protein